MLPRKQSWDGFNQTFQSMRHNWDWDYHPSPRGVPIEHLRSINHSQSDASLAQSKSEEMTMDHARFALWLLNVAI
jgi:hypothetical protein